MGKKKAAQVMKPESSGGFLTPSATSKVDVGIQETKKVEQKTEQEPSKQKQEPKKVEELEPIENMSLEELEQAINDIINKYKEFSDTMIKVKEFIPFLEKIAKYLKWTYVDFQNYYDKFLRASKDAFEIYLNRLSLAYSKKKFNIQI